MENSVSRDRIKFYSVGDLANFMVAEDAVNLLLIQSERGSIDSLNDALEIHNALEFLRHKILPKSLTAEEYSALVSSGRRLGNDIAGFFATIDGTNIDTHLTDIDRGYVQDLLRLIDRFKVTRNVGGAKLYDALLRASIPLWAMLGNKSFVKAHDERLRNTLLSDSRNGELFVRIRFLESSSGASFLPASLSAEDAQRILKSYIDSESPHPNYVEAIANSHDNRGTGITPKIRLAAQRRLTALTESLFADGTSTIRGTSFKVFVDPQQEDRRQDRIERTVDGVLYQRAFGRQYLEASTEPGEVLANFAHLIGYSDGRGLLTLPSFRNQIRGLERIRVAGKGTYPRGAEYFRRDCLSILGTEAYCEFLQQEGIEVENVVAWYFHEYIPQTFGIKGFVFAPSTASSKFLERCRHLCAEMESIAKQFTLYCDEGEIDRALLETTSVPLPWAMIPSLTERKYLVQGANKECESALQLLFSDQSALAHVKNDLQSQSFVQLVKNNQLKYEDLNHVQTGLVDWLVAAGLVAVDDGIVRYLSAAALQVLLDIYLFEAGPFEHYVEERAPVESLIAKRWLKFHSALLSPAEASYFNFYLNKSEFADGHDLRNRYLHGTNPKPQDEVAHRTAYLQLVRLTIALALKIHDDFERHLGESFGTAEGDAV